MKCKGLRVCEKYGLIWVSADADTDEPDLGSIFDLNSDRLIYQIPDVIAANALAIIDYLFDAAHFAFVHPNSFADSKSLIGLDKVEYRLVDRGFTSEYQVPLAPQGAYASLVERDAVIASATNLFVAPLCHHFKLEFPDGDCYQSLQFATPTSESKSYFFQFAFGPGEIDEAYAASLRAADEEILKEHIVIMESCHVCYPKSYSFIGKNNVV